MEIVEFDSLLHGLISVRETLDTSTTIVIKVKYVEHWILT